MVVCLVLLAVMVVPCTMVVMVVVPSGRCQGVPWVAMVAVVAMVPVGGEGQPRVDAGRVGPQVVVRVGRGTRRRRVRAVGVAGAAGGGRVLKVEIQK